MMGERRRVPPSSKGKNTWRDDAMTVLTKKHMIRYNRGETRAAWICLLPSVIGLVCITYIPMIASFTLSLFNWNGLGEMKYIGLDNYIRLFTRDTKFYGSLLTTLEYACLSVIGSIISITFPMM